MCVLMSDMFIPFGGKRFWVEEIKFNSIAIAIETEFNRDFWWAMYWNSGRSNLSGSLMEIDDSFQFEREFSI